MLRLLCLLQADPVQFQITARQVRIVIPKEVPYAAADG
jgi:hypothetical protein